MSFIEVIEYFNNIALFLTIASFFLSLSLFKTFHNLLLALFQNHGLFFIDCYMCIYVYVFLSTTYSACVLLVHTDCLVLESRLCAPP